MNERIDKLLVKAGAYFGGEGVDYSNFDPKKFAELIVEKFDDILVLELVDCIGNQDKHAEQRIERLRERVKTYFGVEE